MIQRSTFVAALACSLFAGSAAAQCELQSFLSTDFGSLGPFGLHDRFGQAVDVDGDVLVIGAPYSDVINAANGGASYVYRFDGVSYVPERKLVHAGAVPDQAFGAGVWVHGDVIHLAGIDGIATWTYNGVNWSEHPDVLDPNPGSFIGAHTTDSDGTRLAYGSDEQVRVFLQDAGGVWSLEQVIDNPLAGTLDHFGTSVAIDGDTLAVAAIGHGSATGQGIGAVHVFERAGSVWSLVATLRASDGADNDLFGAEVELAGERIIVGSTHDDVYSPVHEVEIGDNGSAYVYTRLPDGTWGNEQKLVSSKMGGGFNHGRQVAIDGDVAAIASRGFDPYPGSGDVRIFHERAGAWVEDVNPNPVALDAFDSLGSGIALQGDFLVMGADGHDQLPFENVGRVWTFSIDGAVDLGGGLPGQGGVTPLLRTATGVCPGAELELEIRDGLADAPFGLVFGLSSIDVPFKGGVLVPAPDLLVLGLTLNPNGSLNLAFPWPAGFADLQTWWQVAVNDPSAALGWSLSNALALTAGGY